MPTELTVVATGDSIAARRLVQYNDAPYQDVLRIIREADVAFTNLEIVLNDFVGPASDSMNLSAEPVIAKDLVELGFNLVSFANNHTMNYGEPGVLATIEALRQAGLAFAGTGRTLHEARRPVYLETPAGRIALVAASSTFLKGQQAVHQRQDGPGRAGLNPLRFEKTYVVDEAAAAELKRIAEQTGIARDLRAKLQRGNVRPPLDPEAFSFLGTHFKAGSDAFRVQSVPDPNDLAEITRWVGEASHYTDLVLVSMHCHEHDGDNAIPPDFLVTFARACIDAGASMFIGHGPHALRGLELYQGKPIFYSLSDFFYQAEYVMTLPGEDYVNPTMSEWTPHEFHEHYTGRGTKGSATNARIWETVIPRCVFVDGKLREIEVYPANLGYRQPLPKRGTPRLVRGELAEQTLGYFAELSAKMGTRVVQENGVGRVELE